MSRPRLLSLLGTAAVVASQGCISPGDGPSPPAGDFYFPVAAAISPGGHTIYVANSDFDLQYNAGTVVALDLDRIRAMIPPLWDTSQTDPCGRLGSNDEIELYPGRCGAIDLPNPPDGQGTLVAVSTRVGAFATDLMVLARPEDEGPGARLFIPVRGDPSLTWIDIDDDRGGGQVQRQMYCGQSSDSPRCDGAHRAGEDPDTNLRGAVLPPEPYDLAATEDGSAIVVTHQTTGSMSLVTNPWDGSPRLEFVASGFPYGAVGIAALPPPAYAIQARLNYQPGFLTTFRTAAEVDLVRYFDDAAAAPARPFLTRAGAAPISVNANGYDSRGIAVDAQRRKACEAGCSSDLNCLRACADIPIAVYIANRGPQSLLVGETRTNTSPTGSDDLVTIYDTVPLSYGPSQVVVGSVIDRDGRPSTRVFVSCFDSRYVFIYDPAGHRIDGTVKTGRGPHGMVQDPFAPFLYVVHFTDSYLGVIDLDMRHANTYGTIVASIGAPKPPRESK